MDALAARTGLTEDGKAWLLETLDPFPDYSQHLVGEVDKFQARTLVRKVKKSMTLSAPTSVTGNWDALIFVPNNLFSGVFTSGGNTQNTIPCQHFYDGAIIYPTSGGVYPLQSLTAYVVPTGSDVFPTNATWPWTETNVNRFSGISYEEFMTDRCRLVGGAIEVTNTTAELYRGGQILIGDISSTFESSVSVTMRQDVQNLIAPLPTKIMNGPPNNYATARLVPGAVSWGADEGCYAVLRRSKVENHLNPPIAQQLLYVQSANLASTITTSSYDVGVGNPGVWTVMSTGNTNLPYVLQNRYPPTLVTPFDGKFIYITNQDPHSNFVIDINLIMEFLPDSGNVLDQTLASPSPQLDQVAIELYSHVLNDLPSACPVAENASGDWMKSVASALADWAPVVGSTLGTFGVPGAQMLGQGLGKAGQWFNETGFDKLVKKKDDLSAKSQANAERRRTKKVIKANAQVPKAPKPKPRNKHVTQD